MSALFMKVLKQAFQTFDCTNQTTFASNFLLLKQLTDQLTFRDMHLNQQILADNFFEKADKAPCTYMQIYENDDVSMSVFVMRGNYTMPLHDHPMMHGILKCIYGKLRVLSYTQHLTNPNDPLIYNDYTSKFEVVADEAKVVSPDTECAILTPRESNFHEITAVGSVAAFFDILGPPYKSNIPVYGKRKCRFYRTEFLPNEKCNRRPLESDHFCKGTRLQLQRINTPDSYYCDTEDPAEEVTKCTFLCSAEAYSSY